jgi:hypothetical protein
MKTPKLYKRYPYPETLDNVPSIRPVVSICNPEGMKLL